MSSTPTANSTPAPLHLLSLAATIDPQDPPLKGYQAAIDALVQWQLQTPSVGLPGIDAAILLAGLENFTQAYLGAYRQSPPDATMRKTLDTAYAVIVAQCLLPAAVAVHQDCTPAQMHLHSTAPLKFVVAGPAAPATPALGPISFDIASLTRDPRLQWEEPFILDVTIRYWDQARKAGLPVGDDFGEFYRAVEWAGLHRHLRMAGEWGRAAVLGTADSTGTALLAAIRTTCNRYIELKPLLRLIEGVEGIAAPAGFAFGRI